MNDAGWGSRAVSATRLEVRDSDDARPRQVATSRRAGTTAWRLIADGRLLSVLVIGGLWQLVAAVSGISVIALPAPSAVVTSWWDVLLHGDLVGAIGVTLEALLIGFSASVVLGVPVGLGMGLVRRFRYAIDPYVTILLATPYTAFVPLIMTWTGLGMTTQIVAAFLFSVPFVIVNAEAGVRDVDITLSNMSRSFEATPLQFFCKVVLPGAMPSTFVGLRLGMSHGFKGVFIAEMLVSYAGLGGLVTLYGSEFSTDHLLAVVFTGLVFVLLINGIFELLHRRLLPWRKTSQATS